MHSNIESNEKLIVLFLHTVNTINEKWACLWHYFSHTLLIPVPRSLISRVIPSYTHAPPYPQIISVPLIITHLRLLSRTRTCSTPLTHFMPWILSRPHENIRKPLAFWSFHGLGEKVSGIKWVKRNQDLIIVRSSDRRCSVKKVF